ncbi:hypothetical protein DB32_004652 [Sandaracinus amylolyticus]|uniref:Uncharacterized protein n=1 Tax=Sandaracinus amylolyticus TaxID=927083 RepID=A0A0F6YKN8_9BACT|nr:hypothetical protein DB32_004652 [Sandaracinus amylolyticus]
MMTRERFARSRHSRGPTRPSGIVEPNSTRVAELFREHELASLTTAERSREQSDSRAVVSDGR